MGAGVDVDRSVGGETEEKPEVAVPDGMWRGNEACVFGDGGGV